MGDFDDGDGKKKKGHNAPHSGRKAEKKKAKNPHVQDMTAKQRNPKAFAIQSAQKAERMFRRTMDIQTKKQHIPQIDRTATEPPPFIVAIVGPPKVGKTTLIRCLIKNFCRHNLVTIQGPVTVVSGKKRRLTLIECNNDVNCMIDIAKVADLVLLLVDASFGFEMETFEFLNICQVHGFPKIMGVLTHLDVFKNSKTLRRTKKQMKHRFWTEIYQGAKLFYLSGMIHGEYLKNEVHNLGRFISVMKFHPQLWRVNHAYVLVDRMEDLTNQELIRKNPVCDRTLCFYGYTRGAPLKSSCKIHIPGCGDFIMKDISFLPDPCPLPDKEKRRSLNEKERMIYSPMSGVGGIVYDKDAVYIELGGSHSHTKNIKEKENSGNKLIESLINTEQTIDTKFETSTFTLFSGAAPLTSEEIEINKIAMEEAAAQANSLNKRRKVHFEDEDQENISDSGEDDDDDDKNFDEDDINSDDENFSGKRKLEQSPKSVKKPKLDSSEKVKFEDSDEDEQSDFAEEGELNWKDNLKEKAALSFRLRQKEMKNIGLLVYGTETLREVKDDDEDVDEDDNELGGIFRRVKQQTSKSGLTYLGLNIEESSKPESTEAHDWKCEETKDLIRDCFVTGKWDPKLDANTLLEQDDELFGDFEDLETGESGNRNEEDSEGAEDIQDDETKKPKSEKTKAERLLEKKQKLKALFNAEYDEKGGKSHYEELKAELNEQAQLNKSEFENLEDEKRVLLEGYRAGMYVRVEIESVPCELVNHFDANYPLIMGSLLNAEDTHGYVQVRLKKHRWYKKILKTKDPLIFSLGWRRFQTMPIFSIEDHNGRNRMLKYTPEHLYCLASFWGPITPQGTGILALQSVSQQTQDFRIAATGVVLDLDKSTQLVKKLKLTGTPFKIYKKTAFIQGMFNSVLEVTKFEGAILRTVSGLRGQLKKAIRAPPGAFRATFEDKILKSDMVFLRTWFTVDVPKFCTVVASLLLPPEEKAKWQGMKTVGQLKRERNIQVQAAEDSLYKPIERKERHFTKLKIPRELQKQLPYKEKVKFGIVDTPSSIEKKRVAIVQEPHEKEVSNLMRMIRTVHGAKMQREHKGMETRVRAHKMEKREERNRRLERERKIKKRIFQALGKKEKKGN